MRKQKQKTAVPPEGGYVALVGYMAQMLGGAQDFVACIKPKQSTRDGGFETLLKFEHEVNQQDISKTGTTASGQLRRELTQYKFSLNPEAYPVQPSELKEIVLSLYKSEANANKAGVLPTDYVLRTNRLLSKGSQRAIQAALRGDKKIRDFARTGGKKGAPRSKSSKNRTQREKFLPPQVVAGLTRLRYTPLDIQEAQDWLRDYATGLGLWQTHEQQDAINRVVRLLFQTGTSPGSHEIRRDQFEAELAGYKGPQRLDAATQAEGIKRRLLEQRQRTLGVGAGAVLTHRDVLDTLANLTDEALVVITGHGGCGKSIVLWQALDRVIHISPPTLTALIADLQGPTTIDDLVRGWRSREEVPPGTESDQNALARLKSAASGSQPPFLLLGLDGIDEEPFDFEWRVCAHRLVSFFLNLHQEQGRIPPARLLVTCRSPREIRDFIVSRGAAEQAGRSPRFVPVGEFSSSEMLALLDLTTNLDVGIASLLRSALDSIRRGSGGPYSTEPLVPTGSTTATPGVRTALAALRLPVLWGCFTLLGATEQRALIQGNPAGLDALAVPYLMWFLRRTHARRDLQSEDVKCALQRIAQASRIGDAINPESEWINPAREATHWPEVSAQKLLREAILSGLVAEVSSTGDIAAPAAGSWRWQHAWVWQYLRTHNTIG